MGVEYGGECYCDNVIGGGNGPATGITPQANGCSMVSLLHVENMALLTTCRPAQAILWNTAEDQTD